MVIREKGVEKDFKNWRETLLQSNFLYEEVVEKRRE